MNIIKQRQSFFQRLDKFVPKQLKQLWLFGWQTLSSQTIVSLRSNARLLSLNWNTAKSKAYRLSKNLKFLLLFPTLMNLQGLTNPYDIIAVDFCDFGNGHWVLMFAKQTHKGRAIPVYFEILEKSNARGYQNTFIIDSLKHFEQLLGFRPCLVFDRGFTSPFIVSYLCKNSWKFIIRIRKIKTVIDFLTKKQFKVKDSLQKDFLTRAYDKNLRVVISDQQPKMAEPWYLITNDLRSSSKTIINRYYHRFEIEEFFRDAKRLLGLEWLQMKTATSLAVVLWFTILGIWFLWFLEQSEKQGNRHHNLQRQMNLSSIRYWWEQLRSQFYQFGLKTALENSA